VDGEPGHFKERGQRRGECLPVVPVGWSASRPMRSFCCDSTILAPAGATCASTARPSEGSGDRTGEYVIPAILRLVSELGHRGLQLRQHPGITKAVERQTRALRRLRAHGAELVGEVAQYGDIYRYCSVRGPDGIIIGLVEKLN
jgi:hypothetical protein